MTGLGACSSCVRTSDEVLTQDDKLQDLGRAFKAAVDLSDKDRYEAVASAVMQLDLEGSWSQGLPPDERVLWRQVRFFVTVHLLRAYVEAYGPLPDDVLPEAERHPFRWGGLDSLAQELTGEAPNRAPERERRVRSATTTA